MQEISLIGFGMIDQTIGVRGIDCLEHRLDGEPTFCPTTLPDIKPKISRQEVKGEVDIYNPYHWHTLHGVFVENLRRKRIEENMTPPSDAINSALDDFWEVQNGSDGSTEQEKLL